DSDDRADRDELVEAGDAKPAAAQPQQRLTGADDRTRPALQAEPARLAQHRRFHAARHLGPRSRAPAQQRSAIATLRRVGTVMRSPKTRNRPASIPSRSAA